MKVYKKHNCEAKHRSPKTFARCNWQSAKIDGEGPYAAVHYFKVGKYYDTHITLYPTIEAAEGHFTVPVKCSGTCSSHEVVYLVWQ